MIPSHEALRDAVLAAVLPRPRPELPALSELDLRAFWARFGAVSPSHLRLGLFVAVVVVGERREHLAAYEERRGPVRELLFDGGQAERERAQALERGVGREWGVLGGLGHGRILSRSCAAAQSG